MVLTGYVFPSEVVGVVGVSEVSRVEDVDISLVDDLRVEWWYFIGGVGEEVKPIFCLVEGFGEEDEIGAVDRGGLDVYASEFDVFGVDTFGFWVGGGLLPRMWWMEEKE